tara:strand:+ start:2641 stop:3786 length:1146 start_codon:yes stop_codon:yes gene_type:complete
MKRRISILGATGSIGVNALKVVSHLENELEVVYLSANKNMILLMKQIKKYQPKAVCIVDEESYNLVKEEVQSFNIEILFGRSGLLELAKRSDVDVMLNALVGAPGMEPTLLAIKAGVDVALSNKESLVMAGNIIKKAQEQSGAEIFPVDSEHSAIWQCLVGEELEDLNRIILTGSGGPFRQKEISLFSNITVKEALNHPNWDMGEKITIDSATMMNKGLEVIEAYWLFRIDPDQINIIVHPQSIIHSMVEMKDGSVKAQMGVPDMKVPIQYALTYPRHIEASWEKLDLINCADLTFEKPDYNRFPCIALGFKVLERFGSSGAALNLSNDYAVYRFLNDEIQFTDIPKINESVLEEHPWIEEPSLEDLIELDEWVKNYVTTY